MTKAEGVAKRIVGDMVAFRPYIPIVRSFCNPGLKSRHLDQIFGLLQKEIERNNLTLSEIKSTLDGKTNNMDQTRKDEYVNKFREKLEEISETASKEFMNEKTLKIMSDNWAPMEFTCKESKGSYILEGEAIELITALLDDHIIKAQTMKGSPYAKVFLD